MSADKVVATAKSSGGRCKGCGGTVQRQEIVVKLYPSGKWVCWSCARDYEEMKR